MNKIFLFSCFCFLSCYYSCNKEALFDGNSCQSNCIIFEGYVTEPKNNNPVQCDITIEHKTSSGSLFSNLNTIGITQTDSDGYYRFSFNGNGYASGNGYFTIIAEKNGYLSNEIDGSINFFTVDSSNFDVPLIGDILLLPEATFQLSIKNLSSALITDFSYTYKYANTGYTFSIPTNEFSQNISRDHSVGGDQNTGISIRYKKDGHINELNDSIYIEAGDTGIYEIQL